MDWRLLAAFALLALPGVAACTSSAGPHQAVRFVATEDGRTVLDLPTGIRVGPNGLCGYDTTPPLAFDGRFAAWSEPTSLRVVDVATGVTSTHPPGVLTSGRLALLPLDGWRPNVTLVDLANGTSRQVGAPAGSSFVGNFPGAVVAVSGSGGVSVLDPVTGAWRLQEAPAPAAGHLDVYTANRDWVILFQPGTPTGVWSLEVATGRTSAVADAQGHVDGIRGDRLYVSLPSAPSWYPSTTTPPPGDRAWSVRLPAGTDRQAGEMPPLAPPPGNRTVFFRVMGTGTEAPSSGSTFPGTGVTTAGMAGADGITAATGLTTTTSPAETASRAAVAVGGALLVLLGAGAALRRRLP